MYIPLLWFVHCQLTICLSVTLKEESAGDMVKSFLTETSSLCDRHWRKEACFFSSELVPPYVCPVNTSNKPGCPLRLWLCFPAYS